MITRRQFLVSSAAIAANQLLSSCSNSPETLSVIILQGSIPTQLVAAFRQTIAKRNLIKFKPEAQLSRIFNLLETWQEKKPPKTRGLRRVVNFWNRPPQQADLVSLGNYWLQEAIAENLIQPLDGRAISGWNSLDPRFQKLVTQDGKIYGAPYRWGNTVIAYRKDRTEVPEIKDWSDLWRGELKGRISLLDNYREVIGLTAKRLGYSYNSQDLGAIPELESTLKTLHQQVKFYSSDKYLQPLALGDTWVAVGWSSDILPLARRYQDKIGVIVPASGTALWADLWVQPTIPNQIKEQIEERLRKWIEFCWQPPGASKIMLFTNGISPIINQENQAILTKELKSNQDLIFSSLQSFPESEFILPLESKVDQAYQSLWKEIRTS